MKITLTPCVACHVERAVAGHLSRYTTQHNTARFRAAVYHARWIVYVKCLNCGYTTWPGVMVERDTVDPAKVEEVRCKAAVQWNALWLTGSIDGARGERPSDVL